MPRLSVPFRLGLLSCASIAATAALVPVAHAATVERTPSGLTVTLTSGEASALAAGDTGPALAQLPPTFTPEAKRALGEILRLVAGQAAREPGAAMRITVEGPLYAPTAVSVGVVR